MESTAVYVHILFGELPENLIACNAMHVFPRVLYNDMDWQEAGENECVNVIRRLSCDALTTPEIVFQLIMHG